MVGIWKKTTLYIENVSSILVPLIGLKQNKRMRIIYQTAREEHKTYVEPLNKFQELEVVIKKIVTLVI